jgi:hypothetical protein
LNILKFEVKKWFLAKSGKLGKNELNLLKRGIGVLSLRLCVGHGRIVMGFHINANAVLIVTSIPRRFYNVL